MVESGRVIASTTTVCELDGADAAVAELHRSASARHRDAGVVYVIRVPAYAPRLGSTVYGLRHTVPHRRVILVLDTCDGDTALSCHAAGADEILVEPLEDALLGVHILAQTRALSENMQLEQNVRTLERKIRMLEAVAYRDAVTGIPNRQTFDQALKREGARHQRDRQPLAMVMCDIDHFKLYNDTYGHPYGDVALRRVANAIGRAVNRETDLVCRYGGEEFAALLSNTDAAGATRVAEVMRNTVATLRIPHRASPTAAYMTVSCGAVSVIPTGTDSLAGLVRKADETLYAAKKDGRNVAVAYEWGGAPGPDDSGIGG